MRPKNRPHFVQQPSDARAQPDGMCCQSKTEMQITQNMEIQIIQNIEIQIIQNMEQKKKKKGSTKARAWHNNTFIVVAQAYFGI